MHHARLGQVVVGAAELLVPQRLCRAVGRGRDDAAPCRASDHLGLEVVGRHPAALLRACVFGSVPSRQDVAPVRRLSAHPDAAPLSASQQDDALIAFAPINAQTHDAAEAAPGRAEEEILAHWSA